MKNKDIAKDNIEKLEKKISISKSRIKYFNHYLQEINRKYHNKEITYDEYKEITEKRFDGKTIRVWLNYYKKLREKKENNLFFNITIQ